MSEILIRQDLPHINLRSDAAALNCDICSVSKQKDGLYEIMPDGAHIAMYTLNGVSAADISRLLTTMTNGHSVQIYKLRSGGISKYYLCIKKELDNRALKISWLFFLRRFLAGPGIIKNKQRALSSETVTEFDGFVSGTALKQCDIYSNDSVEYIYERDFKLKSNMGLIKCGENKFVSSFSVNNIANIPPLQNVLAGYDYLQVTSFIRPSKEREQSLKANMLNNVSVISALNAPNKRAGLKVHTIVDSGEYSGELAEGILYFNCKFIFRAESLDELCRIVGEVETKLTKSKVIVYKHTVSGLAEYIAALPGNANYGEHYYTVFQPFSPRLLFSLIKI